jgi:hypothetical protein
MRPIPDRIISVLSPFAALFSRRVWNHAVTLVIGAILTPGKRTVANALRAVGLDQDRRFQNYHRVLNRVRWSSLRGARLLLGLLIRAFCPEGPVVLGIDETIERRRGRKIAAKGIYRDPVRSSHRHFVKASGLRWVCLLLLTPIPWAGKVWALPFLTLLAPSQRYCQERRRRHKTLSDWARQMILQTRHWWPDRDLVVVGDNTYAVLGLMDRCRRARATLIVRFRLDAALYEPAPSRRPGTKGRPRLKGDRLPSLQQVLNDPGTTWRRVHVPEWYGQGEREVEIASATAVWYHVGEPVVPIRWVLVRDPRGKFESRALACTDPSVDAEQILAWFIRRWRVETTFQEVRAHLGVETQRQWNDRAIQRTTPVLMGLFSIVTLLAHRIALRGALTIRQAAWYRKNVPTFSDALAVVRRQLWKQTLSQRSFSIHDITKTQDECIQRFADMLCYAA